MSFTKRPTRKTHLLLAAAALLAAIGACALPGTVPTPTPMIDHPLQGTSWFLITFGPAGSPAPVFPGSIISLEFDNENGILGSGGCNSYTGTVSIQGQSIAISNLVSDLMACANPALLDQEGGYYDSLKAAESYLLTDSALTIFYGVGSALHFADSPPGGAGSTPGAEATATGPAPTSLPTLTPASGATAAPSATSEPPTVTTGPTSTAVPEDSAERIRFETGAISAQVTGSLDPAESDLYVLFVLSGQTMTVELEFDTGEAILVIWGADGTVLVTDHVESSSAVVEIPSSQDYYVMVKGHPDQPTDYTMTITIPPPE